mmetsp:Transcript_18372/g.53051  ORF Transcript_18372/g.53051 Transcript_18372/m.53051 type:complete len:207 (-) Transcript_18372:1174-1794(-)
MFPPQILQHGPQVLPTILLLFVKLFLIRFLSQQRLAGVLGLRSGSWSRIGSIRMMAKFVFSFGRMLSRFIFRCQSAHGIGGSIGRRGTSGRFRIILMFLTVLQDLFDGGKIVYTFAASFHTAVRPNIVVVNELILLGSRHGPSLWLQMGRPQDSKLPVALGWPFLLFLVGFSLLFLARSLLLGTRGSGIFFLRFTFFLISATLVIF